MGVDLVGGNRTRARIWEMRNNNLDHFLKFIGEHQCEKLQSKVGKKHFYWCNMQGYCDWIEQKQGFHDRIAEKDGFLFSFLFIVDFGGMFI